MRDLVWILSSDKSAFFGRKGVFGSYIVPKNDVGVRPELLAGALLWIILRGQEDRLLKVVKIKKVERILEGYHTGDFLIYANLGESFKIVSGYSMAARYKVSSVWGLKPGISQIEPEASEEFSQIVKNTIRVSLTTIPENLLDQVDLHPLPNNSLQLARTAIRTATAHLTLDQLWASGTGARLGAFANFAHTMIARRKGSAIASEVSAKLKTLDPTFFLLRQTSNMESTEREPINIKSPKVDTEFTEIEPDNIYAREFLFIDSKLSGLEEALNKTEHAEKVHQDMLKDISTFLISRGITPYESGSIDLMYTLNDKLNVFEIKSTTIGNILAQAAKGAFQLACYQNELSKIYDDLNVRLILHKIESGEIEEYASEALLRLGIVTMFYNPDKPWPERVQSLLP